MAASQNDASKQKDNDGIQGKRDIGSFSQKQLDEFDILSKDPIPPKSSGNMSSENTYENIPGLDPKIGLIDDKPIHPDASTEQHIYAEVVKIQNHQQPTKMPPKKNPGEKCQHVEKDGPDLSFQDKNAVYPDLPSPCSTDVLANAEEVDQKASEKLCSPDTAIIYVLFKPRQFICENCNLHFESLDDAEVHVMGTEDIEDKKRNEYQENPTFDVKDSGRKVESNHVMGTEDIKDEERNIYQETPTLDVKDRGRGRKVESNQEYITVQMGEPWKGEDHNAHQTENHPAVNISVTDGAKKKKPRKIKKKIRRFFRLVFYGTVGAAF